jgi:hypothetical protein
VWITHPAEATKEDGRNHAKLCVNRRIAEGPEPRGFRSSKKGGKSHVYLVGGGHHILDMCKSVAILLPLLGLQIKYNIYSICLKPPTNGPTVITLNGKNEAPKLDDLKVRTGNVFSSWGMAGMAIIVNANHFSRSIWPTLQLSECCPGTGTTCQPS